MKVRVKEDCLGYYGLRRRRAGEVFEIAGPKHFSDRWMEKVGESSQDSPASSLPEEEAPKKRGRPKKVRSEQE